MPLRLDEGSYNGSACLFAGLPATVPALQGTVWRRRMIWRR